MERTDLVAGWIAQVGQIEPAGRPFAPAGRILDALATARDTGVVESLGELGGGAREADGAAVGVRRHIAVDRRGDAEHASLRAVEDAALWIGLPLRVADGAQYGVVELLRRGDIVGADHYVCKHALLSFCQVPILGLSWILSRRSACHTLPHRNS